MPGSLASLQATFLSTYRFLAVLSMCNFSTSCEPFMLIWPLRKPCAAALRLWAWMFLLQLCALGHASQENVDLESGKSSGTVSVHFADWNENAAEATVMQNEFKPIV